jgi:hypothetical protein
MNDSDFNDDMLASPLVAVFGTNNKNFNIYRVSVTPAVNFRTIYFKVMNNYFRHVTIALVAVFGTKNKNFNIYHVSVTPAGEL